MCYENQVSHVAAQRIVHGRVRLLGPSWAPAVVTIVSIAARVSIIPAFP